MFKCKHKYKTKVLMDIADYARIGNVIGMDGKNPVVCTGIYKVYRCLQCKCLVWGEAEDNEKE